MAETLTLKQKSALARAVQNPDLRAILFRKAVGVQWFDAFNEAGFLRPSEVPPPVPVKEEGYINIPVWPITDYLVATSEQFIDPKNEKYAAEFMKFIRKATAYAKEHGFGNYRVWWQFSKVIRNIPPRLISANDLELIDYWIDDKYERGITAESLVEYWMMSLLDQKDEHCSALAMGLLDVLYKVMFVDKRYGNSNRKEAILRFDSWRARKITKKAASRAGQALGQQAVEIFQNGLKHILKSLNNDKWSSVWRPAIEDHEQNHAADDAADILVEGLRDALLAYVEEAPAAAKAYVGELLESPFETTRRVAIYTVDRGYRQLGELIGRVIVEQNFASNLRHEMWHLLRNHYPKFSGSEKMLVQDVIGYLVEQDEDGQQNEGATAYKRAIWLAAIKDYGGAVLQRYHECIELVGAEPEHPDFWSYMTSGWVGHESPIPKDELLSMEVDQLVKRLDSYEDRGRFGEPGLGGLVKALRQALKAEPVRYFNQLHKFAALDLAYVHELLEAYGELWTAKAQLPWEEIWGYLLAFCEDLIQQERFWSSENAQNRSNFVANRHWVVGSIGRLIENGTRSDDHAFSEKYLDQAREILLVILEKEEGEKFSPDSDAVSIAINSPRGRCIEAFINLSLRSCLLADKRDGDHVETWATFEKSYEAELARSDTGEYEFVTLVVNYLPNFLYMSKDWILARLEKIFDQEKYQKWLCAMNGYAYVSRVYERIYEHLKIGGHFIRALDDENLKERVAEKIIQNIVVAYINNFESLEDDSSLINQLLIRRQFIELSHLIWFLWSCRKDGDQKVRSKIFELWPRLLDVIDTSTREGKKLASKLCDWSVYVDAIDDGNKNLILAVAPFAEEDYSSHDLLEMIARTSKAQPPESYEIWRRLLERARPDYPEEAVRTALENLVQAGAEGRRNAKDIVSAYLKGGNERPSMWLREILSVVHSV